MDSDPSGIQTRQWETSGGSRTGIPRIPQAGSPAAALNLFHQERGSWPGRAACHKGLPTARLPGVATQTTPMPELKMSPSPGTRLVRHAGDTVTLELAGVPPGWTARVRTNLGRARRLREEIVRARFEKIPLAGASWRDLALERGTDGVWRITLPLAEVGYFKAKAFALDERGFQHWPGGPDLGISIHPSWTRTGNTIYCAFPRMFGPSKTRRATVDASLDLQLKPLDAAGYTVIPPSGTLRDLIRELPHIIDTLGCQILHLLPVSPTPTTFARFGRYGSPYALQDLTAIDPALVEFDKRTTGVDQFRELADAVHARGARLMLDLVINHTGWGSTLWEQHPEWFVRKGDGEFESPGAWSVVWEDLVELDQRYPALWELLAEAFLTWCRRGVDGFRCDAGYKIPTHVWQFITARVRQEFPDAVFLLEGLGGPWESTDELLGEGGMQWAYSELFQNEGPRAVSGYVDHHVRAGAGTGILIHYSETHDNSRLAAHAQGLKWSRHRNRLCAMTSLQGGFGFTCGVEWGATEQVNVHSSRGLAWGDPENLVTELGRLNRLIRTHPCFFDGATLTRLNPDGNPVLALRRDSAEGLDSVLILANTDILSEQVVRLPPRVWSEFCTTPHDLLDEAQEPVRLETGRATDSWIEAVLRPGAVLCLSASRQPQGLSGDAYRSARARADWAISAAGRIGLETLADWTVRSRDWRALAEAVDANPAAVLAHALGIHEGYQPVVLWRREDRMRVTPVPPDHWVLLWDSTAFRARLELGDDSAVETVESIPAFGGHIACLSPRHPAGAVAARLQFEHYQQTTHRFEAPLRYLAPVPTAPSNDVPADPDACILLTNGRGGMSRLRVALGDIRSKYDCLLGANLDPEVPVDRHVFAKRLRAWVNADGFITALNGDNLASVESGPPAHWRFVANAGDGRSVELHLVVDLLPDSNTLVARFSRPNPSRGDSRLGRPLPDAAAVTLTVRVDLEDRNFHWETKFNGGADHHFRSHCHPNVEAGEPAGFLFTPAAGRQLQVWTDAGRFHPEPEWCLNIPHPIEASRGQEGAGDAYSPGWFELPLAPDASVTLVATAEPEASRPDAATLAEFVAIRARMRETASTRAALPPGDALGHTLVSAVQAYVVRRHDAKSVIAGYPWFLDWGRDSLICARGLIAAGMLAEVRDLLVTFGRFEQDGTLPNSIHGNDASNRDTSDAPLWFGVVAEELAAHLPDLYSMPVNAAGRSLAEVLRSIACGCLKGTPNGIRVDATTGLLWSPSHFTWMDTNHPPGTPREGFPVEIQALWIRLLRQLDRLKLPAWDGRGESWGDLARRTEKAFHALFWLEECGWYADFLHAAADHPARMSPPSNALRSNCLLVVALGIDQHPQFTERARRMVDAAARFLVIPGALRTLAPLPVIPPLPVRRPDGALLNDPDHPYWARYEGDEDTRRKPAYHNGTGWTWTFPAFCEALVKAYPGDPVALAAATSHLIGIEPLLNAGCLGHLPEIVDGDAPHTHRGCDAQAWGATEALRVWRWLASLR